MRIIYQAEMNCDSKLRHWHIWIVTQETDRFGVSLKGQVIASWHKENIGYRGGIHTSNDWQIETIG